MRGKILVIDDEKSMCDLLVSGLKRLNFEVVANQQPHQAIAILSDRSFDVLLTDVRMTTASGIDLCQQVVGHFSDLPVVVMTAFGSLETAISAIRAGAYDFITKPVDLEALAIALDRAIQLRRLRDENKRLREEVQVSTNLTDLIGESQAIKALTHTVAQAARSDASVLVNGETGTGKEIVARILHRNSSRSEGPFVAINCAAIPENLLEAELFGYEKGAFTDAKANRPGLLNQANGGTLFLDEIGDMPLGLQSKILRVLQEKVVRPVGGQQEAPSDFRLISATHQDLEQAIEEKRFREDLFFRINVLQIEVPPLRARGNDILLLAHTFLKNFAAKAKKCVLGIEAKAAEKLLAYPWPGNVRELQNCMERAVALTQFENITCDDLPAKIKNFETSHILIAAHNPQELVSLEEVERRYIKRVLEAVGDNKSQAAKILGLDRKTLYRKIDHLG